MDEYLKNENAWLFWECAAAICVICIIILRHYYFKCKKVTPTIEPEDPIKYKIDGVSKTYENAMKYYYKELDRGRRKNTIHLIIYDFENDRVMFDAPAWEYYDNMKTI